MRFVIWIVAITILASLSAPIATSQTTQSNWEEIYATGPTHIALICDHGSCSGHSLEVLSDVDPAFHDNFSWSGDSNGVLEYRIIKAPGSSGTSHAKILTSDADYIHEDEDLSGVLTTGMENNTLMTVGGCIDSICDQQNIPTKRFSGWLSSGGDRDYWLISDTGSTYIESIQSEAPVIVEIWKVSTESERQIVEIIPSSLKDGFHTIEDVTVASMTGEKYWMMIAATETDRRDSVYSVNVFVTNNGTDGPPQESAIYTRINQPSSHFLFRGISHHQGDVDSIILPAGSGFTFNLDKTNVGEGIDVSIHEHLFGGEITQDLGVLTGITSQETISLEIRFHTVSPSTWSGGITLGTSSTDYSGLLGGDRLPYYGDAPDNLPVDESEASLWPVLEVVVNESEYRPGAYRLQGDLFLPDNIDTYLLSISADSGLLIRAQAESGSARIQIQELTQTGTYAIENSSNGSELFLPMGVHSIRVERSPASEGAYTFLLRASQPEPVDPGVFVDLSSKATPYYIFAGAFLLAPSFLVALMMRKEILSKITKRGGSNANDQAGMSTILEELKRRSSREDLDEALMSLNSSELVAKRAKFLVDSGSFDTGLNNVTVSNPMGDVGIWVDEAATGILTFGMIAKTDWKLACARFSFPNGKRSGISKVFTDLIHSHDEVMLGDLREGEGVMFQIRLDPIPETLEIEVTGRVKGESVAIVPRNALKWN